TRRGLVSGGFIHVATALVPEASRQREALADRGQNVSIGRDILDPQYFMNGTGGFPVESRDDDRQVLHGLVDCDLAGQKHVGLVLLRACPDGISVVEQSSAPRRVLERRATDLPRRDATGIMNDVYP